MTHFSENAKEITERLASEAMMMDPKNIESLGTIMNLLDELTAACRWADQSVLVDLVVGIKGITEKLVLNEHPDPAKGEDSIQQGLCLVQKALAEAGSDEGQDCSDEIRAFLAEVSGTKVLMDVSETVEGSPNSETESELQHGVAEEGNSQSVDLSQDRDILESFVMESLDSLDTIEVNVLSLEQDPENVEVMNAIFRPFHTIKGGAGFLNLPDINHFAHEVETLLDDARTQKLMIDERITDLILDAVDLMKAMMTHVKESVEAGIVKDVDFGLDAFLDRVRDVRAGNKQDESKETTGENDGNSRAQTGEILIQKGLASKHDISSALEKQAACGG
jgi:two-component system chemotaxis sensor kinase CheA